MSHKKKTYGMSWQILLPVVVALCLLSPLSCLIFRISSKHYTYKTAQKELDAVREQVMPLIREYFQSGDREVSGEDTKHFLRNISTVIRGIQGQADVLVFAEGNKRIYPMKKYDNDTIVALAEACIPYLEEFENSDAEKSADIVHLKGEHDETYMIQIYKISGGTPRIRKLVTYSPVDYINRWTKQASIIVLAVSFLLSAAVIAILSIVVKRVEKGTMRLCNEAKRIGNGNFDPIAESFSIEELEYLKRNMNQMARRLHEDQENKIRFLQDVSHDLRTPLMSIGGYAQGIEQGVLTDTASAASVILEESRRLTDRVNHLLQLSRLEQTIEPEEFAEIDIVRAVSACIRRMEGLTEKYKVYIEQTGMESELNIRATDKLVEQVLDNLCSNAIRYAKEKVEIEIRKRDEEVLVFVRDDGIGVSKEDLPHIFERSYKGNGGQSGLGLAIAKAAAMQMHGSIKAGNKKNGGAEFIFAVKENKS